MKKARIVTVASVIALAVIAVIVIFVSRGRNMHEFTCDLYFLNETGTSLSAESREIKYRNEIDLPKAVIEKLLKGPDNPRLIRTIGKDVDLLGIDMSDPNNVSVNFSGGYITGDTAKDILTTYSVVKSLCEIYYVDSVKVLVEGADIINPDGEPIGYLTASDINLSTDTNTTETREIMLYFTRKDYQLLVPEMRTVKVTDQQPIEQYI
ncbi:MAG: GerMN domain-containing protein, partial [Oscillospiraceae bacterium]|nr:GerMN domain-containing protein [Oscillospiraceae bacterium]